MSSPADRTRIASRNSLDDSTVKTYLERYLVFWQHSNLLTPRRFLIVFFAGLVLICGATAFIGAVPTTVNGHDIFVLLEVGWRLMNGQRPHVDFTSAYGPILFLISAMGLTISNHSVNGIGYGNAIVAFIVGIWAFFVGKHRLAPVWRTILSLFLAALVSAPYSLGRSPVESSHAMVYNRYGYALVGLILLECMTAVSRATSSRWDEWIGGVSTGVALSLALFLKASYFLVAVVLVAALALFLWRVALQRILGIVLGFSLISLCVLAYLHFDLAAMLTDLRMAAGARAGKLSPVIPILNTLNHVSVLLGVALFSFAAVLFLGSRSGQWKRLKLPLIAALIFSADIGLMSSNAQLDGFPVCAVFAILVLNELTETRETVPTTEVTHIRSNYAAVLFLGALLFVPQFTLDLAGLAYGCWKKDRPSTPAAVLRFTSPNLKPLLLYDNGSSRSEGHLFTASVNDGVALLERETRPNETILTMDMTNPFPYAMDRRPALGGIVAPAYHFSIDDKHRPSDDRYFGNADIVMVPKQSALDDYYYVDFYKAYEPALKQRYTLAAETGLWWMYRRK